MEFPVQADIENIIFVSYVVNGTSKNLLFTKILIIKWTLHFNNPFIYFIELISSYFKSSLVEVKLHFFTHTPQTHIVYVYCNASKCFINLAYVIDKY